MAQKPRKKTKGRKSKHVEFLETLYKLSGRSSVAAFSRACGKRQANMANCLSGNLEPGEKFLRSCVEHLFSWGVAPQMEIAKLPHRLQSLPTSAGIYVIYDSGSQILYIGKAKKFGSEVYQTLNRRIPVGIRLTPNLKNTRPRIRDLAKYLSLYEITSERARHNFEVLLLRIAVNQTHNSNIGRFI